MLDEVLQLCNGETYFGKVLGSGAYSIAIKVDYPYIDSDVSEKLKDPVLIVTTEKEKVEIMKGLFGDDTVAEINIEAKYNEAKQNWLDVNGYETEEEANDDCYEFNYLEETNEFDLYPVFERIQENNLFCFYMESAESFEEAETTVIGYIFSDLGHCEFNTAFFEDFSTGLEIEDVAKYIDDYRNYLPKEEVKSETFLNRVYDLMKITERDIMRVAKVLSDKISCMQSISLDIHPQQFLKINGQIVCSDPFVLDM